MGKMLGSMGNKNVMDSSDNGAQWSDLDSSEKGARTLGGAMKGAAGGLDRYQAQKDAMARGGGAGTSFGGPAPTIPTMDAQNLMPSSGYQPGMPLGYDDPRLRRSAFYGN